MTTARQVKRLGNSKATAPLSITRWLGIIGSQALVLYLLLALILGSGLLMVDMSSKKRFAINELQQLRDKANNIRADWGKLLLEQSTFAVDGRIEDKARQQLKMQTPDISKIRIVAND
ncbi:MAG: cell division protein FtsL [Gammaproteobacteria bacterium]|nr:cell division protein FtsL [Gammaproteobacteria bacterium]